MIFEVKRIVYLDWKKKDYYWVFIYNIGIYRIILVDYLEKKREFKLSILYLFKIVFIC